MKKKFLFSVIVAIATISGVLHLQSRSNNQLDLLMANVEALADGEPGGIGCISGGPGSSGCTIEISAEVVGSGGTLSCSVTCNSGYYACCTITGCYCQQS